MPLTVIPEAANLKKVYSYLDKDKDPVKQTRLAFGCVTPPQGFAVPTCRINVVPSGTGMPPGAAAGKLGIKSPVPKYRATLSVLQAANPGTNTACYLTTGVYETNWTFLAQDYKAGVIQALKGEAPEAKLPSYLIPWENPSQKRVYLIMPADLAPLNAGAEREHCSDFIHAFNISLQAVHAAFQKMAAAPPLDGYWSEGDARRAMERKVEEQLPPALRPIVFDPAKLAEKFKSLQQKSRDGRDGLTYHSFGLELLSEPPPNLGPVQYLTGAPRPEAGRVYMRFTRGTTQIGVFPSSSVIQL
jgi:hypothetical protein